MKITRSNFWKIMIALALLGGVLVATGIHKKIIRSVHFRLLNAGLVTPGEIGLAEFERLDLLPAATEEFQLLDEEGNVHLLSEWESEVVFLNKWATWCAPCIAEMPGIQSLYENAGGQARFVMVTYDTDFEKAKRFKERKGFTFPIYQVYGFEPETFKTPSIPATFIFPKSQKEMYGYVGMRNYDTPEFKDFLQQLNLP
jgi:thiol-disulfide isomerase/thioredoxin